MKILLLSLIILIGAYSCNAAKILGIIATPSYSHQVVFHPLWKELSLRGHQVTVITTDPINDPSLTNLTEIDLSFSYKPWQNLIAEFKNGVLDGIFAYFKGMQNITVTQMQHPQIQAIFKNETQQFDVVLVEYVFPMWFGVGQKLKCPTIAVLSLDAPNSVYSMMGSPAHPVLYPEYILSFVGKLSFSERVTSAFATLLLPLLLSYFVPDIQSTAREIFEIENLDLQEASRNIEMLFVNRNPIMNTVRPLTPLIVEIGGGIHLKPPKPLPPTIEKYLDNAEEGFIYFSLGTNAKSKDLPKSFLNVFLETFSQLPYKVLWKYENDNLPGKPNNVMISKWLQQQDVLRHPNIKLFIYQCGLQSTEEALFGKVPVLCIPMIMGDQEFNAKVVVSKGMGLTLDRGEITSDILNNTIFELISNPNYKNRVNELSGLLVDQPMTPLEKAVWWTEYVIRHNGTKHLRNPASEIPFYQYYLLDVMCFILLTILSLIFALIVLLKLSRNLLMYLFKLKKLKTD